MKKTSLLIILVAAVSVLSAHANEAFFETVQTGTAEEVQAAIEAGADVHARDENGATPLMVAAESSENPEVIKLLLEAGADVHARCEEDGTPLMYAAGFNENLEVQNSGKRV